MPTQLTGTVVDGGLELDQPVELPDNTRVSVTLDPVSPMPHASRPDTVMVRLETTHPGTSRPRRRPALLARRAA